MTLLPTLSFASPQRRFETGRPVLSGPRSRRRTAHYVAFRLLYSPVLLAASGERTGFEGAGAGYPGSLPNPDGDCEFRSPAPTAPFLTRARDHMHRRRDSVS